jgi:Arc/MetJ-type ribon-helix-helix transcriptional regulator
MQIDLPSDIVQRLQLRVGTAAGSNEAEVIRNALDSLDWQDQERQAIQVGIDAWHAGDVQDFEKFDADFRTRNGIRPTSS